MNWRKPLVGPFSALQLVSVIVAVLATAGLLAALNTPIASTAQPTLHAPGASFVAVSDPEEGLHVGDLAPEFTGTVDGAQIQLTDLAGNPIRLADLRGRPVWIN